MTRERIAFRTTKADNAAIEAIANALPRSDFPSLTATCQAALSAAAHLAREGALAAVLLAAKKQ